MSSKSAVEWREKNREKYLKYKRDWARQKRLNNSEFREREQKKDVKKYHEDPKFREDKLKFFKKWRKKNSKKFSKIMLKNYEENKNKWYSRAITSNLIRGKRGYKKTSVQIDHFCKRCGIKENLEIHHEIYPTLKKEIEKAILDGKIYFLCKNCHKLKKANIYKV